MSPTPVASGGNLCRKCKRARGVGEESEAGREENRLPGGSPSCRAPRRGGPAGAAGVAARCRGARERWCLWVQQDFYWFQLCFSEEEKKKERRCRGAENGGGGRRERRWQCGAAG